MTVYSCQHKFKVWQLRAAQEALDRKSTPKAFQTYFAPEKQHSKPAVFDLCLSLEYQSRLPSRFNKHWNFMSTEFP